MAGIDPRTRGSIVHRALEDLDFDHPAAPDADVVRAFADDTGITLSDAEVEEIRAFVDRVRRLAAVRAADRSAGRITREAWFAFALEPDGSGPLVRGIVDVLRAPRPTARTWSSTTRPTTSPRTRRPAEYIARNYETQRLVYALAALRAGAPRVEVAYCLLERPAEPVTRTFTAARRARPRGRAQASSPTGVIHHDYEVTADPAPRAVRRLPRPARALQPPAERDAQASAGSLAGSTGPSYASGRYFARRRSTTALSSAPNSSARFVTHSQTSRITAPANAP